MLRGRAWTDGTHVNDTDPSKGYGQARKRGPSRHQDHFLVNINTEALHPRRHRRAQEPDRRGLRARQAQLGEGEVGPGGPSPPGLRRRPRPGAGPQRGHRRQRLRLGVLQGRLPRPGLPRGDGDGQQHVPLAQAAASGGSPACRRPTCSCTWTGASACSGPTRRGTGGARPQGSSAT